MCLLRTSLTEEDCKLRDAFGKEFIAEIREVIKNNYLEGLRILKNFGF
jgi:hypothetical protein